MIDLAQVEDSLVSFAKNWRGPGIDLGSLQDTLGREVSRTWASPSWSQLLDEATDLTVVMLTTVRNGTEHRRLVGLAPGPLSRWVVFDFEFQEWIPEILWSSTISGRLARAEPLSKGDWEPSWAVQFGPGSGWVPRPRSMKKTPWVPSSVISVPPSPSELTTCAMPMPSPSQPTLELDDSPSTHRDGHLPLKGTIFIVDVHNIIYRLYHGLPSRVAPVPGGQPINAVVGWVLKCRELWRSHRPTYMVPVFDCKGDSWRSSVFPDYKANRSPRDEALTSQFPLIWRVTKALQLKPVRMAGLEADDLIGAYAEAGSAAGLDVVVLSNDKDLLQLVRDGSPDGRVRKLDPFDGSFMGPQQVREKFGVDPWLLRDLLALAGDSSDGIPGVPGIGIKTGAALIHEFGPLEKVLENAKHVRQPKRRARLKEYADAARMSYELVGLRSETALPIPLHDLDPWTPSLGALDAFFKDLGFASYAAVSPATGGPPHRGQ